MKEKFVLFFCLYGIIYQICSKFLILKNTTSEQVFLPVTPVKTDVKDTDLHQSYSRVTDKIVRQVVLIHSLTDKIVLTVCA